MARAWAEERWIAHELVFCSPWGTPLLGGNVLRDFRKLLRKAGILTTYRVHDLRHTAGSHLLAEGVPLPEVSQILGHANPAITARLYAHAVKRTHGAAFRQLGAYYQRTGEARGGQTTADTENELGDGAPTLASDDPEGPNGSETR
jgi:integrase